MSCSISLSWKIIVGIFASKLFDPFSTNNINILQEQFAELADQLLTTQMLPVCEENASVHEQDCDLFMSAVKIVLATADLGSSSGSLEVVGADTIDE